MASPQPGPNTFLQRLIGAAALDAAIYEEVEADQTATSQAMAIVVLSSLAAGIGARGFGSSITSVAFFGVVALMSWATWALVMFEIGSRIMPDPETRTSPGELLRTLGFAATPGLASLLGAVPGVTTKVFVLVWLWMLMAMVVAVRQALDYRSTAKAIAVCALGGVLAAVIALLLGIFFGPTVS
jgi:hypothetical protein